MPAKADDGKPATRADLHAVGKRLDSDLHAMEKRLDSDLHAVEKRLDAKIDRVATELIDTRADLHAVEKRLDEKIDRVATGLVRTQADVREIKEIVATKVATKDDINRVLNAIDSFAEQARHYDRAAVLHGQTLTGHEVALKDHEKRIASLESPRS